VIVMALADESRIIAQPIEKEMRTSYLDYAMSVIVSRALPDVRDGLKPVQRRILFGMLEAGLRPDRPYRKSAAVVGDVMKKYHPHGDVPIYESLVRMAQPWVFRYPLVDGQGNWGSIDGDSAAAMRYSECRLTALALELLADIDKDTVDFIPNYDEYEKEPVVLPAKVPSQLMNGASGIAVGMASNIPPHNLGELVDGLVAMIDAPNTSDDALTKIIKGPDFPTGGLIIGRDGIKAAYATGRGSITLRAKTEIEELKGGRAAIIITEIPFLVNKSALIARIAELVRNKKLAGVADLRDESDRSGMRVVVELRRDANPQIVRNQLFKHTQMQTTFGANMLALVGGVPRTLKLREMLDHYLTHRRTVVIRRTKFELARAEDRAHILEGLKAALRHLVAVIELIKKAKDVPVAREGLMKRFKLIGRQADAILEMRLQRLTALEREKIEEEYEQLVKDIARYKEMLRDATSPRRKLIMAAIRTELLEMKEKYGDARRTKITNKEAEEFEAEDLIPDVDVVISLTHDNYIKRQPLETYRLQRRGTRGVIGVATKEEDFVQQVLTTTNHAFLLFFSDRGKVYRMKAHEIPEAGRTARGTAMVNLLALAQGEHINAMIWLRSFEDEGSVFMVTRRGIVKRTGLMEFINAKRAGIFAITLRKGDSLVDVKLIAKNTEIILATKQGKAMRFKAGQVREMGRAARGVTGVRLRAGDEVVGVADAKEGRALLTITELGLGKRTPMGQYPGKGRGGMGVINVKVTTKTGAVVSVRAVDDDDEILLGTTGGVFNRISVAQISVMSRNAQGVRIMKLGEGERLAAVARIPAKEEPTDTR
jgi:DNA gyrase subunit A